VLVHAVASQSAAVPAQSGPSSLAGASPFAKCEQLFTSYPLAAAPLSPAGRPRSMVLMTRADGEESFFVLTEAGHDLFRIRAFCQQEAIQEIIPGEPVPDAFARAIADGMPVPRDRAVLGWVADRQVTAILEVRSGHPADAGTAPAAPEIQVMPMAGTTVLDWPPFTASPLSDGRFWDYLDRGDIVDMASLLARRPGQAFRAACPHGHGSARSAACVVVPENLVAGEYWLPAGVYTDHWMLREGIPAPPAGQLLALPGTVDLACNLPKLNGLRTPFLLARGRMGVQDVLAGDAAGVVAAALNDGGEELVVLAGDVRGPGRLPQRTQGRDVNEVPDTIEGLQRHRVARQLGDPAVEGAVVADALGQAPRGRRRGRGVGDLLQGPEIRRRDAAIALAPGRQLGGQCFQGGPHLVGVLEFLRRQLDDGDAAS